MTTSVENEWLCARILRAYGLPVAHCDIAQFGSQGRFQLTPLYDVLSIWPIIGNAANKISWHNARLAMSVRGKNKHYLVKDIRRRHFNEMAARCGLGETAEPLIKDILAATPAVIASVQKNLPKRFPQHVLDAILKGLTKSAKQLEGTQ